jgi:succinate dehydrogenase/fumarate reductase cytochrome b subunit
MPESAILKLIKSILLPVDTESLRSVVGEVRQDVQSTSWLQLFHRIEGVAILILIPGMVVLGGVVINNSNFSWNNLSAIGPQYVIGVLLIALLLTVKSIIWVVKRINKGESVWGVNHRSYSSIIYQLIVSSVFVISAIYVIYNMNTPIDMLIVLSITSFFILGCIIAGVSGILTCVFLIYGFN